MSAGNPPSSRETKQAVAADDKTETVNTQLHALKQTETAHKTEDAKFVDPALLKECRKEVEDSMVAAKRGGGRLRAETSPSPPGPTSSPRPRARSVAEGKADSKPPSLPRLMSQNTIMPAAPADEEKGTETELPSRMEEKRTGLFARSGGKVAAGSSTPDRLLFAPYRTNDVYNWGGEVPAPSLLRRSSIAANKWMLHSTSNCECTLGACGNKCWTLCADLVRREWEHRNFKCDPPKPKIEEGKLVYDRPWCCKQDMRAVFKTAKAKRGARVAASKMGQAGSGAAWLYDRGECVVGLTLDSLGAGLGSAAAAEFSIPVWVDNLLGGTGILGATLGTLRGIWSMKKGISRRRELKALVATTGKDESGGLTCPSSGDGLCPGEGRAKSIAKSARNLIIPFWPQKKDNIKCFGSQGACRRSLSLHRHQDNEDLKRPDLALFACVPHLRRVVTLAISRANWKIGRGATTTALGLAAGVISVLGLPVLSIVGPWAGIGVAIAAGSIVAYKGLKKVGKWWGTSRAADDLIAKMKGNCTQDTRTNVGADCSQSTENKLMVQCLWDQVIHDFPNQENCCFSPGTGNPVTKWFRRKRESCFKRGRPRKPGDPFPPLHSRVWHLEPSDRDELAAALQMYACHGSETERKCANAILDALGVQGHNSKPRPSMFHNRSFKHLRKDIAHCLKTW